MASPFLPKVQPSTTSQAESPFVPSTKKKEPVYNVNTDTTIGRATKSDLQKLTQPISTISAPGPEPSLGEKIKTGVLKFGAETGVALLDLASKSAAFLSDFTARNPGLISEMVNPALGNFAKNLPTPIKDAASESWKNVINSTSGKITDNALKEVEKLQQSSFIQPSLAYQNASLKEKLTTQLPETLLHLGANVAGSWLPYLATWEVGAGLQALSIAQDIKGYARNSGMDENQSDALALGTGVAVGLLDKLGFEKVFGEKALSDTFLKGFFSRIAAKALSEAGTEVLQEDVQIAAEKTVRDDLSLSEIEERNIMSALGGFLGGTAGSVIVDTFNGIGSQFQEKQKQSEEPSTEEVVLGVQKKAEPPISQSFATNIKPKEGDTLMEKMRSKERFQLGIDTKTMNSLNIGDPATPTIGSVFEVNNELFIVRDVDQTKENVIGYKLPMDGSSTISLQTSSFDSLQPVQTDIGTITNAIQTSQIPTSISRSSQFVTNEEAVKTLKKYFNDEDLDISFVEKINTPEGGIAFGRYTPAMIELVRNPYKTTADHEAVHAYLDLFYEENEKNAVYEAAREQMARESVTDTDVEEWVADRFARFVQGRSGVTGAIKDFFDRVVSFLRRTFRRTNPDAVAKLFEDIRTKNRPTGGKVLNSVQREYYQKPEELTAKIFTLPEVSDRVTIGRTHLYDLMKSSKANLKQAERLLLEDVLNTQFKPVDDPLIGQARKYENADEFVKDIEKRTLLHGGQKELKGGKLQTGMSVRGDAGGIFFSPNTEIGKLYAFTYTLKGEVKTGEGKVHKVVLNPNAKLFDVSKQEDLVKLSSVLQKEGIDDMVNTARNGVVDWMTGSQYFEEIERAGFDGAILSERPAGFELFNEKGKLVKAKEDATSIVIFNNKNFEMLPDDTTEEKLKEIWNQSQKPSNEKIDIQAFKDAVHTQLLPLDANVSSQYGGEGRWDHVVLPDEIRGDVDEYYENIYQSPIETRAGEVHFGGSDIDNEISRYFAHTRLEDMGDFETRRIIELQSDLFQKGRLEKEKTGSEIREKQISKLESYSQTWWQRIIREEIRKAAVNEKKVLLFPTGETAMKIEGLGEIDIWYDREEARHALATPIKYTEMKIGQLLFRNTLGQTTDGDGEWVITDILEDGKFKAIKKTAWDDYQKLSSDISKLNEFQRKFGQKEKTAEEMKTDLLNESETFDISGKIDTKNPIYKFYESDVGMYLNRLRKGNIEPYTDLQGVTWLKTAITQEDLGPVLAYQKAEQIPEEDYKAYLESGAIPDPDATLSAEETVAAYEIEKELGYIPKAGEMPAGLAAQLDERRHNALIQMQESDLNEQTEKEQAVILLEEGLFFQDSDMENSFENFKNEAKRKKWMLDSATDDGTLKSKLKDIDVDRAFFPSVEGMSNDDMLEAYKNRIEIENELIEKINKKTAMEIRAEAKRLAERVVKSATIKKFERVKTTINRIQTRPKTMITVDEMKMLQARLKAMALGAKAGSKFMKDEMIQKWRQSETDRLDVVNQLADYMAENLPTQQRGRFVRAIGKIKDLKNALALMDQIDRVQENMLKREAIGEIKEQITRFRKGGANISLDYANRIRDILSSFDVSKPTEATLRRLNAMASFLSQNPDAFVTSEMINKLKRLTKTPLAEMSLSEIQEVKDTVSELARLGKLKQDLKNIYDERVWSKNVQELIEGTTNRDVPEGSTKIVQDALMAASSEVSAPARVFDSMDGDLNYQGPNVRAYRKIRSATQHAEIVANDIAMDFLQSIKDSGLESLTEEQQRVIYLHAVLDQGNEKSVETTMKKYNMDTLRPLTEAEQKVLDSAKEAIALQTDDFAATYEEKHNLPFTRVQNYIPFRYADANPTSAEDFVMDERFLKSSVEPGSVKERLPSVQRELRTDFINIVMQAIENQSNYIYVEPTMMDVAALVKSKEYREAAGTQNSHYWNEYIDMVARNGASANAIKMRGIDPFIKGVRFNVTAAILGGRLTTIVLQPFNLFHAYGILNQKYGFKAANQLLKEVAKTFLNGTYYKDVTAKSPALTLREGGDATVREMIEKVGGLTSENRLIQARNKMIEWSLKVMKDADLRTAAATNETFYKILRANGLSDEQARNEADFTTDLITASSQIADRPMIFSRGEMARTFSMFSTFALNEWGIISHDIMKTGLLKGDYQAKYRAGFALSMIFTSKMLEQVVRNALSNLFKREEDKKDLPNPISMSIISMVSAFPFLGPAVASAMQGWDPNIVSNPIISTTEDFIKGTRAAITGKKEQTKIKGAVQAGKAASTLTGIPILPLLLDWIKNIMID